MMRTVRAAARRARRALLGERRDMSDTDVVRCSCCGASQYEVRQIVAGPGRFICNVCVADAAACIATGWAPLTPAQPHKRRSEYCQFCAKPVWEAKRLVYRGSTFICSECVCLCLARLSDDDPEQTKPVRF